MSATASPTDNNSDHHDSEDNNTSDEGGSGYTSDDDDNEYYDEDDIRDGEEGDLAEQLKVEKHNLNIAKTRIANLIRQITDYQVRTVHY